MNAVLIILWEACLLCGTLSGLLAQRAQDVADFLESEGKKFRVIQEKHRSVLCVSAKHWWLEALRKHTHTSGAIDS